MPPTIHEVDEVSNDRRSESRQTQLSCSSSTTREPSVKSSSSLRKRSSSGTNAIKRVSSASTKATKKDSGKQLSHSKDKISRSSVSSRSSLVGKETEESLSRRSSVSQKSLLSEKQSAGSNKQKRASLKSISSKQKVEKQVSRTSSRGTKSISSDESDTMSVSATEEQRDRINLSSLIDLYYATPNRKSTTDSLELYMKKIIKPKDEKPQMKLKIIENKNENVSFSDAEQKSDTDESFVIKRGNEDTTDDENFLVDRKEGMTVKVVSDTRITEDHVKSVKVDIREPEDIISRKKMEKPSEEKTFIRKTFSKNFETLMNEVSRELRTSFKRHSQSVSVYTDEEKKGNRRKSSEKRRKISEQRGSLTEESRVSLPRISLEGKLEGSIRSRRSSKGSNVKQKKNSASGFVCDHSKRSSKQEKSNRNSSLENQMELPTLEKRKTLPSDHDTIAYLTNKKIISLSKITAVRLKNKKMKEEMSNDISDVNLPRIEAT